MKSLLKFLASQRFGPLKENSSIITRFGTEEKHKSPQTRLKVAEESFRSNEHF